jgi:outer membrane protein assembly factor BamB
MRATGAGALVAVLAAGVLGPATSAAADAITHQGDAAHTGHARVPGLNPPLHRAWTRRLPYVLSYPVIGDGRVFVAAFEAPADGNTLRSELVAMSLRNGRVIWRRPLGLGVAGQLGLEAGRVFVTRGGYEEPAVEALAAADGRSLWRRDWAVFSSEPPVPVDGVVYVPLQDYVAAFRASDGALMWTSAGIGHGSSVGTPAIAGDSIWITFACENVYRLRRSDGAVEWANESPCHGGGGETSTFYRGRLFSREGDLDENGYVYDADTGARLRPLTSTAPAAFARGLGFFPDAYRPADQVPHTLVARSVETGKVAWRFRATATSTGRRSS